MRTLAFSGSIDTRSPEGTTGKVSRTGNDGEEGRGICRLGGRFGVSLVAAVYWPLIRSLEGEELCIYVRRVGGAIVQKHALALGYFFLAVFCVFTSAHSFVQLRFLLLLAAILAVVVGVGYVASPLAARVRQVQASMVELIRIARQPPTHGSATSDEKHV